MMKLIVGGGMMKWFAEGGTTSVIEKQSGWNKDRDSFYKTN